MGTARNAAGVGKSNHCHRMSYDRTRLTLGELLTSDDTTIKRNAMSILKVLSGCDHKHEAGRCIYCFKPAPRTHGQCPECFHYGSDCTCIK